MIVTIHVRRTILIFLPHIYLCHNTVFVTFFQLPARFRKPPERQRALLQT